MAGADPAAFAVLTRLLIVGRQNLSVAGLASLLEAQKNIRLDTCTEQTANCLERLATLQPDALLIQDESLPQAFEPFIHDIKHQDPAIRILMFGAAIDDDRLYHLVRAGVHGYINERAGAGHIQRALREVLSGGIWIKRSILKHFVAGQENFDEQLEAEFNGRIEQLSEQLSCRELEILGEVIKGLAIKQIAEHVHLSHQGVKMHLAKLFRKFHVSNRNQLILAVFDEMSPVEDLSTLLQRGLFAQLQQKRRHNGYL